MKFKLMMIAVLCVASGAFAVTPEEVKQMCSKYAYGTPQHVQCNALMQQIQEAMCDKMFPADIRTSAETQEAYHACKKTAIFKNANFNFQACKLLDSREKQVQCYEMLADFYSERGRTYGQW